MKDETPKEHYSRLSNEAFTKWQADLSNKNLEFEWLIFSVWGHVFDLKEKIAELEAKLEAK